MTGTTTCHGCRSAGEGPRPRSTGSRTEPREWSTSGLLNERFVGAVHPGREGLPVCAVAGVVAEHAFDVVGQLRACHLEPAQLPTEGRVLAADRTAEMDLEALSVVNDGALEPDVGGLETRARVGATVEVDRDRCVEVRQASLELFVEFDRADLGFDDRELAELDAGARHRAASEHGRLDAQVASFELLDKCIDTVVRNVANDDLLLDRHGNVAAAVLG